jgi:hypothetical protein
MLINSAEFDRTFKVSVEGLPGIHIDSGPTVAVASASNRLVALRVRAEPDSGNAGSNPIDIVVEAVDDPTVTMRARTSFFLPDMFQ